MQGTRFKSVLRESFGNILREFKVAFSPVPKPKKWVFLVGCYNSGTTLLSELMSQHPSISALPTEGHFITDQFVKDYDIGLPRMWVEREDLFRLTESDTGPDPIRIKKEWGMRLDLNKPVLLEKSPPNTGKTRWLQKHFENSYFIGIVRNGYAVSEGISRKGDPKHIKEGWPLTQSAWQWARGNQILEEDAKFLKNFIWIRYEDLTENMEDTLNDLSKFLGISSFEGLSKNKKWSIHERNEEIKNMNEVSIKKLSRKDLDEINKVAGSDLKKYGYSIL